MLLFTPPQGLIFDLEAVPPKGDKPARLTNVGGLRPDTGEEKELRISGSPMPALQRLDKLSAGASFVLGHNVIGHDLPILRSHAPQLALHMLPIIDTLRLSPMVFPQSPYHRLNTGPLRALNAGGCKRQLLLLATASGPELK